MGYVELTLDEDNLQFFLPAMIARPTGPYVGSPADPDENPFVNAEFLVDTGSNSSSINESTALQLGIAVDSLPNRQVAGINGITYEPVFPGDLTVYITENLDKTVIHEPAVYHPAAKRVKQTVGGKVVRKPIAAAPMPNLFGLDAIKAINGVAGKLTVDLRTNEGRIEW